MKVIFPKRHSQDKNTSIRLIWKGACALLKITSKPENIIRSQKKVILFNQAPDQVDLSCRSLGPPTATTDFVLGALFL